MRVTVNESDAVDVDWREGNDREIAVVRVIDTKEILSPSYVGIAARFYGSVLRPIDIAMAWLLKAGPTFSIINTADSARCGVVRARGR